MLTTTRRDAILAELHDHGEVAVGRLAARFGVSTSTIRRDLNLLSKQGRLQRVRGGGAVEPEARPFEAVAGDRTAGRERIGALAASLVRDNDVVVLDIGTTVVQVARHLRGRQVTVVTASLAVVDELREDAVVELVVLGGVLRRSYHSLVGSLPEQALGQITADIAFLGTSGVRDDGSVLDSTSIEVPVKRAILAASERRVLVADDDKFPGSGILAVCGPEGIDTLVTSSTSSSPGLDALRSSGTEVITA
ncbi:DeoR/GlpR family DNA-binding transcription regulator [Georgenia satyanarayanai]|uniref:DeoR/GlpR family DNA-binding transcription regulator n=1 Tax=Georgenia satyanarayanai TaxID=860221 RepID=UPI001264CEC9|nr:DeoR/GlpR family DNA-binding transcription regulator [Georgenia satyanarayanai]